MHAFLFRNWKNRVKGRDWYDLEWFIKNGYPLGFRHFKERAIQSGHLDNQNLTSIELKELMRERIKKTSIEPVKEDVKSFLYRPEDLDIWSKEYFLDLVDFLKVEEGF